MEMGMHWTLAFVLTAGVMVLLALVVERVVLRPLVNQPHIILFMATIGITYFLDGFGETLWGSDVKILDIGIPKDPTVRGRGTASSSWSTHFDLAAAVIGAVLVAGLAASSSSRPASAARCARSPTTTRRRCRSASRSRPSG
jgi:branched-chain amino acid transport system permease protein